MFGSNKNSFPRNEVNREEKEFRELDGNIIIRGIYTYVYNELPVNDSPHETHNNTIGE